MRYSARELADNFHFLSLEQLGFEFLAIGDIDDDGPSLASIQGKHGL